MNNFFQSIESENNSLLEQVTNFEAEIFLLTEENSKLEKALDKQKKLHRKYAEDLVVSENIRVQDFKEEKRALVEQNKLLLKETRQLTKDVSFYKKGFEELVKEDEAAKRLNQTTAMNREQQIASAPYSPPARITRTSSVATSTMKAIGSSTIYSSESKHKSSKVLSQISQKLLVENKKIKMKLDSLNKTIKILKSKNQKLEDFKKKIENKKLKFLQDSDELALLVKSTETTNGTTFTPEVLAKLGQLSKYEYL